MTISLGVYGGSFDRPISPAESVGYRQALYQASATPQVSTHEMVFDSPNPHRTLLLVPMLFTSQDLAMTVRVDGISAIECFEYGGALYNRHNIEYGLSRDATGTFHLLTQDVWNQSKRAFAFEYPGMLVCRETAATYSSTGVVELNVVVPPGGFGLVATSASDGDMYTSITNADLIDIIPPNYCIFKVRETGLVTIEGGMVTRGLMYAGFSPANNPDALFTDGFARGTQGPEWLSAPNGLNINSNQWAGSGAGSTYNGAVVDTPIPPDQYAEGELIEISTLGTVRRGHLNVRDSAGSIRTGYSFWCVTDTTSYWRITRWVDGLEEVLVQGETAITAPARCRLEIQGTTIRAFVDGVKIAEIEDSTTAVGRPGCGAYRSSVKWDTFESGAL